MIMNILTKFPKINDEEINELRHSALKFFKENKETFDIFEEKEINLFSIVYMFGYADSIVNQNNKEKIISGLKNILNGEK